MCETPQTCNVTGRAGGRARGGSADVRVPLKSLHHAALLGLLQPREPGWAEAWRLLFRLAVISR